MSAADTGSMAILIGEIPTKRGNLGACSGNPAGYGQVLLSNPVQTGCKATNPNPIPNPKSFTGYASVNSVCAAV